MLRKIANNGVKTRTSFNPSILPIRKDFNPILYTQFSLLSPHSPHNLISSSLHQQSPVFHPPLPLYFSTFFPNNRFNKISKIARSCDDSVLVNKTTQEILENRWNFQRHLSTLSKENKDTEVKVNSENPPFDGYDFIPFDKLQAAIKDEKKLDEKDIVSFITTRGSESIECKSSYPVTKITLEGETYYVKKLSKHRNRKDSIPTNEQKQLALIEMTAAKIIEVLGGLVAEYKYSYDPKSGTYMLLSKDVRQLGEGIIDTIPLIKIEQHINEPSHEIGNSAIHLNNEGRSQIKYVFTHESTEKVYEYYLKMKLRILTKIINWLIGNTDLKAAANNIFIKILTYKKLCESLHTNFHENIPATTPVAVPIIIDTGEAFSDFTYSKLDIKDENLFCKEIYDRAFSDYGKYVQALSISDNVRSELVAIQNSYRIKKRGDSFGIIAEAFHKVYEIMQLYLKNTSKDYTESVKMQYKELFVKGLVCLGAHKCIDFVKLVEKNGNALEKLEEFLNKITIEGVAKLASNFKSQQNSNEKGYALFRIAFKMINLPTEKFDKLCSELAEANYDIGNAFLHEANNFKASWNRMLKFEKMDLQFEKENHRAAINTNNVTNTVANAKT